MFGVRADDYGKLSRISRSNEYACGNKNKQFRVTTVEPFLDNPDFSVGTQISCAPGLVSFKYCR